MPVINSNQPTVSIQLPVPTPVQTAPKRPRTPRKPVQPVPQGGTQPALPAPPGGFGGPVQPQQPVQPSPSAFILPWQPQEEGSRIEDRGSFQPTRSSRSSRSSILPRRYAETTEEGFHRMLDANPEDHHTRMVFADWLQERGDPRAEGYRALGMLKKNPFDWENVWYWGHGNNENYKDSPGHFHGLLDQNWMNQITGTKRVPQGGADKYYWRYHGSRREAEDSAALAFSQLAPEVQQRILQQPQQMRRVRIVKRYALPGLRGGPVAISPGFKPNPVDPQETIQQNIAASRRRVVGNGTDYQQDTTAGGVLADALDETNQPHAPFFRNLVPTGGLNFFQTRRGTYSPRLGGGDHPVRGDGVDAEGTRWHIRPANTHNGPSGVLVHRDMPSNATQLGASHTALMHAPDLRQWAAHPQVGPSLRAAITRAADHLESEALRVPTPTPDMIDHNKTKLRRRKLVQFRHSDGIRSPKRYGATHADATELLRQLQQPEHGAHMAGLDDPLGGLRGIAADALDEQGRAEEATLLRTPGTHVEVRPDGTVKPSFMERQTIPAYGPQAHTREQFAKPSYAWSDEPGNEHHSFGYWFARPYQDGTGDWIMADGEGLEQEDADRIHPRYREYPLTGDMIEHWQETAPMSPSELAFMRHHATTEQFRLQRRRPKRYSMATEDSFHRKIAENPRDNTAHLVYADWLQENGKPALAELIRLAHEQDIDPKRGEWGKRGVGFVHPILTTDPDANSRKFVQHETGFGTNLFVNYPMLHDPSLRLIYGVGTLLHNNDDPKLRDLAQRLQQEGFEPIG